MDCCLSVSKTLFEIELSKEPREQIESRRGMELYNGSNNIVQRLPTPARWMEQDKKEPYDIHFEVDNTCKLRVRGRSLRPS